MKPKTKSPSLDETYVPDETGIKLNPYDRLQSIFSQKENLGLTESASKKLDFLLKKDEEVKKEFSFLTKIKDIFNKLDNFIFRKPSRISNEFHSRKKK